MAITNKDPEMGILEFVAKDQDRRYVLISAETPGEEPRFYLVDQWFPPEETKKALVEHLKKRKKMRTSA